MGSPGAVIPINRDGELELLGWTGNIPAIEQQMQFVIDSLFDLGGKPRSSFGQQTSQQSGVQTNLSLSPTVQSNEYHETIWGQRLSCLNEYILMLWEKNMSGEPIQFEGSYRAQGGSSKYYETDITGSEIGGWYKNRTRRISPAPKSVVGTRTGLSGRAPFGPTTRCISRTTCSS
jgi:hypothetical protein